MKVSLIGFFFLTALFYASVGFGGGSTYTALLVLFGVNYALIPIISLSCNILVVSGNSWRYIKEGYIDPRKIWPFLVLSVPCAWLGGKIHIEKTVFIGLLACALLIAGLTLLFRREDKTIRANKLNTPPIHMAIGGVLGLVSGLVGIGGGIFLAPILYMIGWNPNEQHSENRVKYIAALCSLFILINSGAGLLGQLMKLGHLDQLQLISPYWLLAPSVMVGGYIGNHLHIRILSPDAVRKMTALLILFVAARLLWKFYQLGLS
jgi:uncharacterized membrane protein YfcA